MENRKSLSKSLRFEVFKRDSFRCQYCGRSAPDVILECDHIIPVASGGKNEMINLVTSCRDCNRGKGKKELSDFSTVSMQKKQLDDLNAMREQTEMMIEWKKELMSLRVAQVDAVNDLLEATTGWPANDSGKRDISRLIERFGFEEVFNATQIAVDTYFCETEKSWEIAFSKIGGICYNRKYRGE